jgi:hypothetical protein
VARKAIRHYAHVGSAKGIMCAVGLLGVVLVVVDQLVVTTPAKGGKRNVLVGVVVVVLAPVS